MRAALALEPAHLSQYHLTIEPGTVFAAAPPTATRRRYRRGHAGALVDACSRTRASSSTKYPAMRGPGARCVHNLNYWTFGDYLGIGAGAHGKITFDADGSSCARSRCGNRAATSPRILRHLVRKPIRAPGIAVRVRHEWLPAGRGFSATSSSSPAPGCRCRSSNEALAPCVAADLVDRSGGWLARDAPRLPISQRHTGRAVARHQWSIPPGPFGRFYSQTPHAGPLNKGITAGFNSVAR